MLSYLNRIDLIIFFRNFYGKDNIIKLLNAMGELNMNQLHLRISDDEGWRIQILALPELTDIGANRCYDPNVIYFLKLNRKLTFVSLKI